MSSLHRKLAVLLLVLLAGCSRTELVYDNADWLAGRWAGDLMDASGVQQDAWREIFRQAMAEHRRELLPELVVLLRAIEAGSERHLHAAEVTCWTEAAERAFREHARWAVPPATAVLLDVSPSQIDFLAAELDRRNQEYRDNYLHDDPQARESERVDRYIERIEPWTGDLSTDQLRLIEQTVAAIPDLSGEWLDYRRQQQRRLLALLRDGADSAQLRRFLAAWWVDFADRSPELVHKSQQVRSGVVALIVALDETLTAEQRATFVQRVADLREDLEQISDVAAPQLAARQTITPCLQSRSQMN